MSELAMDYFGQYVGRVRVFQLLRAVFVFVFPFLAQKSHHIPRRKVQVCQIRLGVCS